MSLTAFAFRYRPVTWLVLGSILALGLMAMALLPRREDPELGPRWIRIVAVYPGATAGQVEQLVSERFERALLEIDTVKSVQSVCRPGVDVFDVEASDYTHDIEKYRQDVRHRVEDLRRDLPSGVVDVQINDRFSDTEAMVVGIWQDGATDLARESLGKRLRDKLRAIPEVGEVSLIGVPQRQVEIALSAQRMAQYSITSAMVADAISNRNVLPQTGGSLAIGANRLSLQLNDDSTLGDVLVGTPGVYLRDIATIRRTVEDPASFRMRIDGHPAVAVSVTLRKGSTISVLGDRVRQSASALALPDGAHLAIVNDLPTSVQGRMQEFDENLSSGVGLILAVMFLFMGFRSASIVGALLPLTILGTFAGMYLLGRNLQQISITALIIALGLVVDNSIVVVDNIERRLAEGMDRVQGAIVGTDELRIPLLTSNLTTIASFAPLLLLSGATGEFIQDLGLVTTIATIVSLLFNLTVTPMLAARYLTVAPTERGFRLALMQQVDRLRDALGRLATKGLARPGQAALIGGLGLVAACLILPHLGTQFFPSAVRNQFTVDVWLPEGDDIEATSLTAGRVEAILQAQSGIRSVATYIGRGGPRFYYNINPEAPAANYAQIVVNTDSVGDTGRLVAAVQTAANATIPEARVVARTLEQGPPVGAPVAIRLVGDDLHALRVAGDQVRALLAKVPGATLPYTDYGERPLALQVSTDADRASRVGLTQADVAQATHMALSGLTISVLREGDEEVPVRMRLQADERQRTSNVEDLMVPTRQGTVVPLREVATVSLVPQEGRIVRRNHARTLTVFAFTQGRLASDVVSDVQQRLAHHPLPAGVSASFGGEQAEVDKTFTEMILIFGLTVVANLIIVAWEFNDWAAALTILSAVPLSLTGAVLGLLIGGLPFGFMAFLGVTSLGGIVTNHAIVLFEYAHAEQRHGLSLDEALLLAGRKRLRPILLTVLLSIGGLLPQALNGGTLWPPMAWAMISGLLMSLLLTLVLVPSLYKLMTGSARVTENRSE